MNETIRQARLSYWARIIAQCNRESAEQHTTKQDWMKTHDINSKSFYRKQKEIRELLIESASSGSELPEGLKPSSSFVEIPLIAPARVSEKPSNSRCQAVSGYAEPAGLIVRYGDVTMEISNNASAELLAFAKEVLRNA